MFPFGRGRGRGRGGQIRQRIIASAMAKRKNEVLYNTSNHCVTNAYVLYRIYNGQNGYIQNITPNKDNETMPLYMQNIYGTKNQAKYVADICSRIRERLPVTTFNKGISDIQKEFFVLEDREQWGTANDILPSNHAHNEIARENRKTFEDNTFRKVLKQKCSLARIGYARLTRNIRRPESNARMRFLNQTMHEKNTWTGFHFAMLVYRALAALHLFHTRVGYVHMRTDSEYSWMVHRLRTKDYVTLMDFRLSQMIPTIDNFSNALFDKKGESLYDIYPKPLTFFGDEDLYNKYIKWLLVNNDITGLYNTIVRAFRDFQTPEITEFINIMRALLDTLAKQSNTLLGDRRVFYADELRQRIANYYNDRGIKNAFQRIGGRFRIRKWCRIPEWFSTTHPGFSHCRRNRRSR